ncbi:hypothetical protein [Nonomuraea maritima]|uniref:hypothetical protein n=1 Tax=Nonomuraea maritima TaxID=683260 RepID=UPI00371D95C7
MSDSLSPGSDTPSAAGIGPRANDPDFEMTHPKVRGLGDNVGIYGQDFTQMSQNTRAIELHTLTFGVIGGGLNVAHRNTRDHAADALEQGREVLESWKKALHTAADNAELADEAGKAPDPGFGLGGGPGTGGLGKLPKTGGLGGPLGIDGPSADGLGTERPDLGDVKRPDLDGIDQPGIDRPDLDQPNVDQPNVEQPNLDQPQLDQPNVDQPNLEQPELEQPNLDRPDLDQPKMPDLDGVNQPAATDLAGLDRNLSNAGLPTSGLPTSGLSQPKVPDGLGTGIPRTGVGFGEGSGAGAAHGLGPQGLGSQGSIARALNTGVPLYPPPMTGGGANKDQQDRERGPHAGEGEEVWGLDDEHAPAVLGKEEEPWPTRMI